MTEHAALARPLATSLHGYRVKWPQKCLSARTEEQSLLPAAGMSRASDSHRPLDLQRLSGDDAKKQEEEEEAARISEH